MLKDNELKQFYSITESAAILGFSRARLYQLQHKGVFPLTVYCPYTKRPFYTAELLQRCLKIRRTSKGFNGRAVVFNNRSEKNKEVQRQNDSGNNEQFYNDIKDFIKRNLGENYTKDHVKQVVSAAFPNGLTEYKFNEKIANAIIEYMFRLSKNTVK